MNRLSQLLERKQHNLLAVFITAGYPQLQDTVPLGCALAQAGVDILEIGFPFSDPIADGPTIQHSSQIALQNGMNLDLLFEQVLELRKKVETPIVLMGDFNPLLRYGVEHFCQRCHEAGVDGTILPNLPAQDFREHYKALWQKYGLHNIALIAPHTSDERIREIDADTSAFIYAVSSNAITGGQLNAGNNQDPEQRSYFERLASLKLKHPYLLGFGIHDQATFALACQHCNGAIVGSALLRALSDAPPDKRPQVASDFVGKLRT
jgi:tryptophan synthase alpha chain